MPSPASARARLPPPLPETGPSEIVTLNRGFNQMLANLRQAEQDRALLLAGVSHDLRTPLARLRLGIEVGAHDETTREGMVADIEEMDKIIGQFLDFARDDRESRWRFASISTTSSRRWSSATAAPATKCVSARGEVACAAAARHRDVATCSPI